MARVIFKYGLGMRTVIGLAASAKPLTVGVQNGGIVMWVQTDPDAPLVPRTFEVIATGEPRSDAVMEYIGTVQMDKHGPPLVWHVFEDVHARSSWTVPPGEFEPT